MNSRIKDNPAKSVQDLADRARRLPTGVDGQNVPVDFKIPGSTIEDVDRAIFNLFDKTLSLNVGSTQGNIKVPIIFAGGERVFLVKGRHPPRDRKGMFILPIISIRRTGLEQSIDGVIPGHGLGQNTGDLIIKRRLSREDPSYQSLINQVGLKNQDNVASTAHTLSTSAPQSTRLGTISSRRQRSGNADFQAVGLPRPVLGNNLFEIITMPFPTFYTSLYEVTFWTQYTQHMNSLLERFMTSYDAQGHQFRLETDKGYWYVAYVDDDINSEDNFTDYTDDERYVKYKFNIKVPAYLHGNERHGVEMPFRRYISAPQITFGIYGDNVPVVSKPSGAPVGSGDIDKFTLSDVDELDKRGDVINSTREMTEFVPDPLAPPGSRALVRVLSRNPRKGETVLSRRTIRQIDELLI